MIVTIHQPEYMMWLGLIDKISQADVYVVLDTVQFRKNYFQNRNRIRSEDGFAWLTTPITRKGLDTKIKDIEISNTSEWKERQLNIITEHYKHAPYFDTYFPHIQRILQQEHTSLVELNMSFIRLILAEFGVSTKIVFASELGIDESLTSSALLSRICEVLSADVYLSGPSGKDYLDLQCFEEKGIAVRFHEFTHPTYTQQFPEFIPGMSSLDVLFNHGDQAPKILWG